MAPETKYKVTIVAPTCFYYQVSLFKQLASHPRIDLTVYFCSKEGLLSQDVKAMYQTDANWGGEDELLTGFKSRFMTNYSPSPSYLKWPIGLINFGIWREIGKEKPDIIILMSWMNITWWIALAACWVFKVPYLYMTDANVQAELVGPRLKTRIKDFLLGKIVFRNAMGFLCAGTANGLLYSYYGVPEEKLVPFAYSWGYDSLLETSNDYQEHRQLVRAELGISESSYVVLYCGRLSKEKSPMDLLKAYQRLELSDTALVFVGDGPQGPLLKQYAAEHDIDSVYFCGFQARSEVLKYYAMADALVLPSRRETWGMVINEALCFGLPLIVSDQVGAGRDLVVDGQNGYKFPEGDVETLVDRLKCLVESPKKKHREMKARSLDIISQWLRRDLAKTLVRFLDNRHPEKPATSPGSGPSLG